MSSDYLKLFMIRTNLIETQDSQVFPLAEQGDPKKDSIMTILGFNFNGLGSMIDPELPLIDRAG
jgi:hypothetical protein